MIGAPSIIAYVTPEGRLLCLSCHVGRHPGDRSRLTCHCKEKYSGEQIGNPFCSSCGTKIAGFGGPRQKRPEPPARGGLKHAQP